MNVKLDTIILLKQEGAKIQPVERQLLAKLKQSIVLKLSSIEKALRDEENKKHCYIMFHLVSHPGPDLQVISNIDGGIKISLQGYSSELTNRIFELLGDNKFACRVKEQAGSVLN